MGNFFPQFLLLARLLVSTGFNTHKTHYKSIIH